MNNYRYVGQTKSVGYQVGVRRTFPISQERAWALISSEEGLNMWLGESTGVILKPGEKYMTKMGSGEIRIAKPFEQLRLTWQKKDWGKPSTVQVRLISKEDNKTTISFHQENLSDEHVREEMKGHWESVLEEIKEKLDG